MAEDSDSECTAEIGPLIAELSVKGNDGGGASAVTHGQKIYYVNGDDPVLSKKTTGIPFGIAWSTTAGVKTGNLVEANATTTIRVLLIPANGIISLADAFVDQVQKVGPVLLWVTTGELPQLPPPELPSTTDGSS
jgi:hypothetical protein